MSGFRASMRLYGLVKNLGSTDVILQQSVEILCTVSRAGSKAIRAFVSRLDAELMVRTVGLNEYRVVPLSSFNPNLFIQEQQGWLALHVSCGFAVRAGLPLLSDGALLPMGWYAYSDIGQWTASHHLDFGPQMASLLQTAYERVGQRNYNAFLNELDSASHADLQWQVDEAWRALGSSSVPLPGGDHHALFDPVENRWCFAATDIDIYHFHPETQKQGALT
ncbi:hypothetical protein [Pseudomonas fluorescens]|uniref:hypothetical protein n=1 Tax=Pseudomonas fluorescens TaxID=294 RepID=UPI003D008C03